MLRKLHCGIKKDGGVVWVEGCLLIHACAQSSGARLATSNRTPKRPLKNLVSLRNLCIVIDLGFSVAFFVFVFIGFFCCGVVLASD